MASTRYRLIQFCAAFLLAVSAMSAWSGASAEVSGAGSTFVAPIITKWADNYAKVSGVKVEYQSVGSGAGIQKIKAGEVDFGASDKPLDPAELAKAGLCQFPIVIGGVVPVVNLPGIGPDKLKFSGKLLAAIYLGKITHWDDNDIRRLNTGLTLPHLPITVVHRSDGSGTTYNWADFLAKASPEWKTKVGIGLSVNWPIGVGGNGNGGVAAAVQQTTGAIGYVEYAYAVQNKLVYGQVQNAFALYISPNAETFQAAAASVDWTRYEDFSVVMTDLGGPTAYPVTATTFILMYKSPKDIKRSTAALNFFKWALEQGDKQAEDLNYVPLPSNLIIQIEKYWVSHIKGAPITH
jgi:phosphate transport system substrate-binding protein